MAALLIALIIFGLYIYLKDTIKSDTNDSYEESSKAQSSSNFQSSTFYFEDVVVDVFIAVVKLTPDLHVLGDGVKERMREYALKTFKKIDGSAANTRTDHFASRINPKEQIKVKELQKKVSDKLKYYDFQYKKEILIGMWSIAYADGQATLDQQKLISIIGKAMGLPYTTCNKVETMFWQRMRAGKFGDYKEFEKRRN